jgi:PB1 domain.
MDLIVGCGGAEGWRSLFSCAMETEQDSITAYGSNLASSHVDPASRFSQNGNTSIRVDLPHYVGDKSSGNYGANNRLVSAIPESIPNQVEFKDVDHDSLGDSLLDRTLSYPVHSPDRASSVSGEVCFKLTDSKGHKYLIRSEGKLKILFKTIVQKVDGVDDVNEIRLKFIDEEGDEINITSDECLTEAIIHSRKNGDQGVKLILSIIRKEDGMSTQPQFLVMIGGIASLVALGITAMTFYRRSK